jgi:hypothetical protein
MWPPMKPTKEQEPIVTARHGTNANDAHEIFEHVVVHSMVQSRAHTLAAGRQLVGQPMTQPHRTSACVWFSDLPPGLLSEVDRSEWSCVLLRRWCPSMMSQRPLPLLFHWRGSPLPSGQSRLKARGGQRPPTGTPQPTTGLIDVQVQALACCPRLELEPRRSVLLGARDSPTGNREDGWVLWAGGGPRLMLISAFPRVMAGLRPA